MDGYHQLGKFISRLEKNPMIFGIELLRIKVITRATTVTKPADKPEKLGVELTISELLFEG